MNHKLFIKTRFLKSKLLERPSSHLSMRQLPYFPTSLSTTFPLSQLPSLPLSLLSLSKSKVDIPNLKVTGRVIKEGSFNYCDKEGKRVFGEAIVKGCFYCIKFIFGFVVNFLRKN